METTFHLQGLTWHTQILLDSDSVKPALRSRSSVHTTTGVQKGSSRTVCHLASYSVTHRLTDFHTAISGNPPCPFASRPCKQRD
eukprot:3184743-Amphidinium_carterae.1